MIEHEYVIELQVLYIRKALLTSGMTDIRSQFNLRAYGPPDKEGGEGHPRNPAKGFALCTPNSERI